MSNTEKSHEYAMKLFKLFCFFKTKEGHSMDLAYLQTFKTLRWRIIASDETVMADGKGYEDFVPYLKNEIKRIQCLLQKEKDNYNRVKKDS